MTHFFDFLNDLNDHDLNDHHDRFAPLIPSRAEGAICETQCVCGVWCERAAWEAGARVFRPSSCIFDKQSVSLRLGCERAALDADAASADMPPFFRKQPK